MLQIKSSPMRTERANWNGNLGRKGNFSRQQHPHTYCWCSCGSCSQSVACRPSRVSSCSSNSIRYDASCGNNNQGSSSGQQRGNTAFRKYSKDRRGSSGGASSSGSASASSSGSGQRQDLREQQQPQHSKNSWILYGDF